MTDNIAGKVIVITGASSGMGAAAARHLATMGAAVVLGARRADRISTLAAEIIDAGGKARPSKQTLRSWMTCSVSWTPLSRPMAGLTCSSTTRA